MKSVKVFLCMSFKLLVLGLIDVVIRQSGIIDFSYVTYLALGWCVSEMSQVMFDLIWDIFVIEYF